MTYKEALARYNTFGSFCDDRNPSCDHNCINCESMNFAIIYALEKQIAKAPYAETAFYGACPNCGRTIDTEYCEYCGQAIDWSEVVE